MLIELKCSIAENHYQVCTVPFWCEHHFDDSEFQICFQCKNDAISSLQKKNRSFSSVQVKYFLLGVIPEFQQNTHKQTKKKHNVNEQQRI